MIKNDTSVVSFDDHFLVFDLSCLVLYLRRSNWV